jgi:SAM-dependent methyltransferase
MSNYRDALESYLKRLDIKADSVYDVGGKELPINGRVKSWDVKECDILDLPEFDLNKPFILNEQSRQVVFCLEVMEYINNPVTAMINLGRLLVDGGTLYITFPFIYPTHNPVSNDYARYTYMGAIKLLT